MLLAAGSYVGIGGLGYLVIVYFVSYANRVLGLPLPTVLGLVLAAAVVLAASIVAVRDLVRPAGTAADDAMCRRGPRRLVVIFFPLADTARYRPSRSRIVG